MQEELDVIQISQKIFSNSPKNPFTYQLVFDTDLKICYQSLLTMFTYGMKMLYGNSIGKVNLLELQERDINRMKQYFHSFGINIFYEIQDISDYIPISNHNKQNLSDFKFLLKVENNIYTIYFDFLHHV
tara:strand:+ start:71 stop:457 length:387 start_codon:yes stop_codon:yes gene_type:complete